MDGYYEDADNSYPTTRVNGELKSSCMSWAAAHTAVPLTPEELTLGTHTHIHTSPNQAEITNRPQSSCSLNGLGRKTIEMGVTCLFPKFSFLNCPGDLQAHSGGWGTMAVDGDEVRAITVY